MPYEYGGQTWPDTPWVARTRTVKLLHPSPDTIDFYRCQWTDGTDITLFREGDVMIERDQSTFIMAKDAVNGHVGTLRMSLVPGQPGDVRCKAGVYENPVSADIARDVGAYRTWQDANPGEHLNLAVSWSDWSNSLPIGTVEPNPVPEPGLVIMLMVGTLGLVVAGWLRKTR